jgi:hypothetical protein
VCSPLSSNRKATYLNPSRNVMRVMWAPCRACIVSILPWIELPGAGHRHGERPQRMQHPDGAGAGFLVGNLNAPQLWYNPHKLDETLVCCGSRVGTEGGIPLVRSTRWIRPGMTPQRPPGTDGMSETDLAKLITPAVRSGGERPNIACQRRRSTPPDNHRTRAISAAMAAASTNRCSMVRPPAARRPRQACRSP